MGDIKKPRKKYERPYKPWDRRVLEETNRLCGYYGLRNKRELWRMSYLAKKYRRIARQLLAAPESERVKIEPIIRKLQALGILGKDATLDDLLDLSVEQFLERRLQTIVWRKGLAKSPYMARQLITHGHVRIDGRRIRQPSYLVKVDEEDKIECTHPACVEEAVREAR
ncbi:MAG: 30S ribosomal protein S4 [Candidatus Korarchaeum sp.]